jgi:long-chain acyl-CoA synthetase
LRCPGYFQSADDTVRRDLQKEIESVGRSAGLAGFEIPTAIHLDHETWTVENGLVTPTLKVKRHEIMSHYKPEIERLYRALEN